MRKALAVLLLAAAVGVAAGAQQRAAYTLSQTANGVQLKTPDGRAVLEYLTSKPEGVPLTVASTSCFHPVFTPGGERVTSIAPDDHPHHRGIFLAWEISEFREPAKYDAATYPNHPIRGFNVHRADFWGWGEYAPRDGRVIKNRDVKLVSADASRAVIELHNDWTVGNRKYLDESTTATVSEREGVFVIDLEYRLTPSVDYFLDRQAFSGFAVQMRKDGSIYYADPNGKVTLPDPHYSLPDLNWPSQPWYDYTIHLTSGKTVGAAVLDHPKNPSTTWHNFSRAWMLNPVIVAGAPMTIGHDQTLTLRYRVVTHDGETPTAVLNKLSAEYK